MKLRTAAPDDAEAIHALARAAVLANFPQLHTPEQTASAALHITRPDELLLADGTYFVAESEGRLVACGGWSRRAKLYTGSGANDDDARLLDPATEAARVRAMFVDGAYTRRGLGRAILDASREGAGAEGFRELILMATLLGRRLYRAYGFTEVSNAPITMPDGTVVGGSIMKLTL